MKAPHADGEKAKRIMNEKIVVMTQEDGNDKVVSAIEWRWYVPQVGATVSVCNDRAQAASEVKAAVADGYRPTGDTTRELIA